MATQIKKNEAVVLPAFKNGVSLQFVTITFPTSGDASLLSATAAGVRSPVAAVLDVIATVASIEIIGAPTSTTIPLAVAALGGDFVPASGTFAAQLQTLVRNGTTLQGVAMNSVNVGAGASFT